MNVKYGKTINHRSSNGGFTVHTPKGAAVCALYKVATYLKQESVKAGAPLHKREMII
jgi:hypothetical protein